MTIKKAETLIKDVNKIMSRSEHGTVAVKGVKNLSIADLDTLIVYAETYIRNGGTGFSGLMSPMGDIRDVLAKYGLEEKVGVFW